MTPDDMRVELEDTAVDLEWLFRDELWAQRAAAGLDQDDASNPQARLALATLGMLAAALALIALATWRTAAAVLPLFGSCS